MHDGRLAEKDLVDYQKERALRELPSLLDYAGYVVSTELNDYIVGTHSQLTTEALFPVFVCGPFIRLCGLSPVD